MVAEAIVNIRSFMSPVMENMGGELSLELILGSVGGGGEKKRIHGRAYAVHERELDKVGRTVKKVLQHSINGPRFSWA